MTESIHIVKWAQDYFLEMEWAKRPNAEFRKIKSMRESYSEIESESESEYTDCALRMTWASFQTFSFVFLQSVEASDVSAI